MANAVAAYRGADTGGGGGGGAGRCTAICCGAGARCARARCMFFRMLETTPIRTIAIQMIEPMSCIEAYRPGDGGCGGWFRSEEAPPSTLLPMESRMPVSACRFLSL